MIWWLEVYCRDKPMMHEKTLSVLIRTWSNNQKMHQIAERTRFSDLSCRRVNIITYKPLYCTFSSTKFETQLMIDYTSKQSLWFLIS